MRKEIVKQKGTQAGVAALTDHVADAGVTYFALKFLEHMSLDGANMARVLAPTKRRSTCRASTDLCPVKLPAPTRTQLQEIYKVRTLCLKALEHHAEDPDVCLMGARLLERVAHNGTFDCGEVNGIISKQMGRAYPYFTRNVTSGFSFQRCLLTTTAPLPANDQPIQSAATVNTLLQVLERHGAAQDDLRHAILAALAAVLMNCELAVQTADEFYFFS